MADELSKKVIAGDWLPRYTGMPVEDFGDFILLTNFKNYVDSFAAKFDCEVKGLDRPMQAASNGAGLTIVNFGIGTANAATIMDLLTARMPEGVLFLGKCGGLKRSTEIGHFILPIAAIRVKGHRTTTSRRWCRHCPRSSCTNSCRRRSRSGASSTEPVSCTRPIGVSGSTIRRSSRSCGP